MNSYNGKIHWKLILLLIAVFIGISSLLYTNKLVNELKEEERKKVELWASATKQLIDLDNPDANIDFLFQVIENNNTVPVVLVDSKGDTISTRNIDANRLKNSRYFEKLMRKMKSEHEPIEILLGNDVRNYIYFKDSLILTKLKYYPYVQISVIMLFIMISYLAFSGFRKFEQNQVWVGLTKETAHQLGTPTSSLIGWVDVLKLKNIDPKLVSEFERDVQRLEKITERFSKVGSKPKLTATNIVPVIFNAVNYIKNRSSNKIKFTFNFSEDEELFVPLNIALFDWVVENVAKNAIDAIRGDGELEFSLTDNTQVLFLDIRDNGKGIHKSKFKTIFKPGFTTRKRGWGLGLSLSQRIIEMYHKGKIFVYQSEIGKGTTIRIVLKK
ncbi:MAG: hypothetical protein DRI73_02460 [Bacteroidetes bacterium]|nr:MAG: hypothetical protein DRI73_02460 [Bacteroidota bacterium]